MARESTAKAAASILMGVDKSHHRDETVIVMLGYGAYPVPKALPLSTFPPKCVVLLRKGSKPDFKHTTTVEEVRREMAKYPLTDG